MTQKAEEFSSTAAEVYEVANYNNVNNQLDVMHVSGSGNTVLPPIWYTVHFAMPCKNQNSLLIRNGSALPVCNIPIASSSVIINCTHAIKRSHTFVLRGVAAMPAQSSWYLNNKITHIVATGSTE
jgi:hypothetical protein